MYAYVVGWTYGQYSDTFTRLCCFFTEECKAEAFIAEAQRILDRLVHLDVSPDLPWGIFHDHREPDQADWERLQADCGDEVTRLIRDLLGLDIAWLGHFHAISVGNEPRFMVTRIPRRVLDSKFLGGKKSHG